MKHISLDQIKLLIFDIDGSLVDRSLNVAPETLQVLQEYREKDIPFTLATGKNWDAIRKLVQELAIDVPLILSNGTIIRDGQGNLIERIILPSHALEYVIEFSEKNGYDLMLYYDQDIYVKRETYNIQLTYKFGSTHVVEVGEWDAMRDKFPLIHKIMLIERKKPLDLYKVEKIMREDLGDSVEYCQSLPAMFEVMPKGVTKGSAISRLCAHMGLDSDTVIAFGDGNNDKEMLAAAGLGVALANGSSIAKANADLVVPSVERCGPAQFLQYILDNQSIALA
jgi:hypothetical protein